MSDSLTNQEREDLDKILKYLFGKKIVWDKKEYTMDTVTVVQTMILGTNSCNQKLRKLFGNLLSVIPVGQYWLLKILKRLVSQLVKTGNIEISLFKLMCANVLLSRTRADLEYSLKKK